MSERATLSPAEIAKALLDEFSIEDYVYNVRERTADDVLFVGNSWEHPKVKRFVEICDALRALAASPAATPCHVCQYSGGVCHHCNGTRIEPAAAPAAGEGTDALNWHKTLTEVDEQIEADRRGKP